MTRILDPPASATRAILPRPAAEYIGGPSRPAHSRDPLRCVCNAASSRTSLETVESREFAVRRTNRTNAAYLSARESNLPPPLQSPPPVPVSDECETVRAPR